MVKEFFYPSQDVCFSIYMVQLVGPGHWEGLWALNAEPWSWEVNKEQADPHSNKKDLVTRTRCTLHFARDSVWIPLDHDDS